MGDHTAIAASQFYLFSQAIKFEFRCLLVFGSRKLTRESNQRATPSLFTSPTERCAIDSIWRESGDAFLELLIRIAIGICQNTYCGEEINLDTSLLFLNLYYQTQVSIINYLVIIIYIPICPRLPRASVDMPPLKIIPGADGNISKCGGGCCKCYRQQRGLRSGRQ